MRDTVGVRHTFPGAEGSTRRIRKLCGQPSRKLCTRVFLGDVVSSSSSGGTSRARTRVFCPRARARAIGVTRIPLRGRFIVRAATRARG